MKKLLYLLFVLGAFTQAQGQNNTVYGAGISYTNGAPSFTPASRTSRVAIDTVTGKWYHFNTSKGWQLLGNTIEEIAGCTAPAYTPTKGDSKVVINNCTNPELYYWTGSAWVWINEGTTYYAGEGIRIQNDSIILDSLYYLQFRTGDTTDLNAGRLSWNAQEGTLDVVINSGNVTGQLFEDIFFNCKNQTGSTITRGTVVMAVGTLGASGRILIAPAIADGSVNSEYILGTAAQDIANGADGLVYHFGKDRGLNTTGASCGETWADGDVLYCSATTPGCLTKTIPTAPNLKVPIAIVLNAANNGTLFVRPSHFPDLNQINDVQLTSPTTGQTLIYNSVTGVWSNQTPADPSSTNELQTLSVATNTATLSNSGGSVTIAGAGINTVGTAGTTITVTGTEVDGSVSNELQTLSTGTNTLTLSNGGGTVTVDTDPASDVTGSGASERVSFWTGTQTQSGDNTFTWNNTNGLVSGAIQFNGYGTTTPTTGQGFASAGTNRTFYLLAGNNNNVLDFEGLNFSFGNIGRTVSSTFVGLRLRGDLLSMTTPTAFTTFLTIPIIRPNLTTLIGFDYQPDIRGTVTNHYAALFRTGFVGMGTPTPAARLHVVGSGSTSTTWTAQFHNSAGNNNALMIRDDGNVGIGTSTMTQNFNVGGASYFNGTVFLNANVNDNRNNGFIVQSANTVPSNRDLIFGNALYARMRFHAQGLYLGASFPGTNYLLYIDGGTASSPIVRNGIYLRPTQPQAGGNTAGGDIIMELPDGTGTARKGAVLVGTETATGPSAIIEFSSTDRGVLFPRMTTTQRNLISSPADGLVIYNTTDNKLQVRAAGVWVDLH